MYFVEIFLYAVTNYTSSVLICNLKFHFRYIQSTCATSGEGLYEGLDWLSNNIASKVKQKLSRPS